MDAEFFLVHKMKSGDEEAMEQFVRDYYGRILSYCRSHAGEAGMAEDLAQETFEHFFQSLSAYRHRGKLANYLYVIAGNLCRDSRKKQRERAAEHLPDAGENPLEGTERRMDLETAIRCLPQELREVILLHYVQDLKLREVAEVVGIGLPLVKYRLKKAKERLKILMGEEE